MRAGLADLAAVSDLLARCTAAGPYFEVALCDQPPTGSFRLVDLYRGERVLLDVLADYALRLRVDESRVAASLLFQGVAARLCSPLLLGLAGGLDLDLDPYLTYFVYRPGAAMALYLDRSGERPVAAAVDPTGRAGAERGAAILTTGLIDRHLRPLAERLSALTKLAAPIAWGNAGSSISTAARLLAQHVQPGPARRVQDVVDIVLSGSLFSSGGTAVAQVGFLRRSCCLWYRAPNAGICPDCPLGRRPARRPSG